MPIDLRTIQPIVLVLLFGALGGMFKLTIGRIYLPGIKKDNKGERYFEMGCLQAPISGAMTAFAVWAAGQLTSSPEGVLLVSMLAGFVGLALFQFIAENQLNFKVAKARITALANEFIGVNRELEEQKNELEQRLSSENEPLESKVGGSTAKRKEAGGKQ